VLSNGETLTVNTGVAADPGDAGNFLVAGGAILALQTAVSSDQTIAFGDLGAELVIGDAKDFAATLTGFVAGDTIDVANTIVTSATISGGMLTANIQGGGTQTFAVTGDFSSDHLEVASDGNNGTDLILYRLAQASVVANPVEFGFVHVGEAVSEALTVTNTGVAGLFTENLDASFGNATGNVTASGAFVGLSAGSSNSNSLTVGLDTQSAAVIDSSVTIALTSDGSGIDNLGSTTLAAQTIDVTGTINNYVTAQFEELSGGGTFSQSGSDYTLDLGTLAAGSGSAEINLGVLNAAIGPADFLSGSFVATSPSGTDPFSNNGLNPFTGLAAGQDYTGASIVVDTSDIGTFSETIALDPTGYNPGGYLAGLGAEMLTITEETAPCYSKGTYILTPSGEVAVEALRVGETVSTLEGTEIVRWIGRRRIDLSRHPRPETAAPIRIECGAFMDNVPHRDLLVSPDHAIYVDGKLICARQLVNGTTIRQEKGLASVEYFHVELGAHSILLAERLPAESYLNTGNKSLFANQSEAMALYPELANEVDYPTREAASCAPFVWEEAVVQPVWQRLANRAALLGRPVPDLNTTTDPELRVIVNNRTLRPVSDKDGVYTFVLRAGASAVQIISRANAPTDVRPWLEDTRLLGVYVHRIVLRTMGEVLEIPVDHPGLWKGWWAVERNGTMLRRWTNGDALLPLPDFSEPTILEIHASASGVAYLIKDDRDRGIKSNDVIRREAA
jgi:hypothetical protein